jgi:hypothetical protein
VDNEGETLLGTLGVGGVTGNRLWSEEGIWPLSVPENPLFGAMHMSSDGNLFIGFNPYGSGPVTLQVLARNGTLTILTSPCDFFPFWPFGINDGATVIGTVTCAGTHAYKWDGTTGQVTQLSPDSPSIAGALSDNGDIGGSNLDQAVLFEGGNVRYLSLPSDASSSGSSAVTGITETGLVFGEYAAGARGTE